VLDDALAPIASMDGELSLFVAIDADRVRRAAEVADAELKNGRWGGHLHGVPIAVKELFDVENLPATYGSQERTGVVAAADCEVVRLTWTPLLPDPDSVLQLTVLQLTVSRQPRRN